MHTYYRNQKSRLFTFIMLVFPNWEERNRAYLFIQVYCTQSTEHTENRETDEFK